MTSHGRAVFALSSQPLCDLQPAGEDHLDLLLGLGHHAFEELADEVIVEGHGVIGKGFEYVADIRAEMMKVSLSLPFIICALQVSLASGNKSNNTANLRLFNHASYLHFRAGFLSFFLKRDSQALSSCYLPLCCLSLISTFPFSSMSRVMGFIYFS